METGPGSREKQMRVMSHSPAGFLEKATQSEPGGEQELARAPSAAGSQGCGCGQRAGGSGRTRLSGDELQPRKKPVIASFMCCDRELQLHPIGRGPPVESFS